MHSHYGGDNQWLAQMQSLQIRGLPQPCLVRFKVFTLDERLILKTLGHLAPPDRDGVAAQLHQLMG